MPWGALRGSAAAGEPRLRRGRCGGSGGRCGGRAARRAQPVRLGGEANGQTDSLRPAGSAHTERGSLPAACLASCRSRKRPPQLPPEPEARPQRVPAPPCNPVRGAERHPAPFCPTCPNLCPVFSARAGGSQPLGTSPRGAALHRAGEGRGRQWGAAGEGRGGGG